MDKDIVDNITSAITSGRTDIVRALVTVCEKGEISLDGLNQSLTPHAFLNSISNEYGTLLHMATKLDHVDIVRTLLASGADASVKNADGYMSYDFAESSGMLSAYTEELLKCAAHSDIERIDQLLCAGVPIDAADSPDSGNTALHWAASFGNARVVKHLIDQGAAVNVRNSNGATPLHDAVQRKDIDVIKVLLESGADCMLTCTQGKHKNKNAYDLCNGNKEILALLKSFSSPSSASRNLNHEDTSIGSCSLESLRVENGLSDHVGRLSLASLDDAGKTDGPMFASHSPAYRPIPHLSSPLPLVTDSRLYQLWPLPREIIQTDGSSFKFKDKCSVSIVRDPHGTSINDVVNIWHAFIEDVASLNSKFSIENIVSSCSPTQGRIICHVNNRLFDRDQSYKIIVTSEQIKILAADILGLHYGLCTMKQLLKLYKEEEGIPSLYIKDWPSCFYRAVLLDLVPGARKPNMETLKCHIKHFSSLKLNQIHFYFRFESRGGNKWPYSNSDLISIASYCHQHHIEPVPSLDVNAECSYDDLSRYQLPLQELISLFCTRQIQFGPNLSRVLLDMLVGGELSKAGDLLAQVSDCLLFICINGFSADEKLPQLLPPNTVLVEYGYQEDHNYDASLKPIILAGLPVVVGVGTCSWGSIAGSPEMAVTSIHKAAQAASLHNALGMIVADWKSVPHHCAFSFSWPGVLLSAGLSWNNSVHVDFLHIHLPTLLDHCIFLDSEQLLGRLVFELGRLEAFVHQSAQEQNGYPSHTSCQASSSSVLHRLLVDSDNVRLDHLSLDVFQQAVRHIKRFEADLQKAKPQCFQKGEVVAELQLAMDLMVFACRVAKALVSNGLNPYDCGVTVVNAGVANLPPIVKTDLANRLLAIVEQFRGIWLSRNLPCGLHTSLYLFNSLLHKFIPNSEQFFSSADGFLRQ